MSPFPLFAAGRAIHPVTVPLTPAVVPRLTPLLAAAMSGGPAMLPLPPGPAEYVARLIAALVPAEPIEVEDAEDPIALLVPTSGSSAAPRGVLLSAAALRASASGVHEALGGPGRWVLALPATHIAGLQVLLRSMVAGTDPVAMDLSAGFEPAAFVAATRIIEGEPATRRYTALVPIQLSRLLDAGRAAEQALRVYDAVLVGGAALPEGELARALAEGVRVVTTYGLTETCGGCVIDGRPLSGVELALDPAVAGDQIRIRGPVLMRGYRMRPEETRRAFDGDWLLTSDRGALDDNGSLRVCGRMDDVAVSGGVSVSLHAVESAVAGHPDVAAAAAVALPDPLWGERVVVAVVARDPRQPPTHSAIRSHVLLHLPAANAPRATVLLRALPMLGSGKVDRRRLRDDLADPP